VRDAQPEPEGIGRQRRPTRRLLHDHARSLAGPRLSAVRLIVACRSLADSALVSLLCSARLQ
jgi:hypothetical protein